MHGSHYARLEDFLRKEIGCTVVGTAALAAGRNIILLRRYIVIIILCLHVCVFVAVCICASVVCVLHTNTHHTHTHTVV